MYLKPVPVMGTEKENHTSWERYYRVSDCSSSEEQLVFGEMNLSEIVRSGAQMMLQYALEREVTEALGRNYYENAPADEGEGTTQRV